MKVGGSSAQRVAASRRAPRRLRWSVAGSRGAAAHDSSTSHEQHGTADGRGRQQGKKHRANSPVRHARTAASMPKYDEGWEEKERDPPGARRARQGAPATTARGGHRGSVRPSGGQLPADIPHREVQPAVPVLHARGGHRPDGEGRAVERRRGGARREALRGQRRGQDQAHRRRTHRPPRPRGNHPQTPRLDRAGGHSHHHERADAAQEPRRASGGWFDPRQHLVGHARPAQV